MITFEPPELREQLSEAIRILEGLLDSIGYFSDDLVDPTSPDFDEAAYPDLTVRPQSEFQLGLPYVADVITMTYGDLLSLADELNGAELVANVEGWTARRLLLRIEPGIPSEWYMSVERALEASGATGILAQESTVDGVQVRCSLVRDSVIFGILVVAYGYYEKHFPPIDGDHFIEVLTTGSLPRETVRAAANAYMFELAATLRIDCRPSARPDVDDFISESDQLSEPDTLPQLRPLLMGSGLEAVIEIYNRAIRAYDASFEILGFTKVIEHVSQTVVRQQLTDAVRAKLASPRALSPDAGFVLELEHLMAELRVNRKDKEAIRLTVQACCEAVELQNAAPPFLKRLRSLTSDADEKERRSGLEEFAFALSATRNWIAHAKAGYTPTGEECPPEQLGGFASCARLAAEQAIRWYAARHESSRVT